TASVPPKPATAPLLLSRKSPVTQPVVSPLGTGDHVRPPSSDRKTPDGYSGDPSPSAQPCRTSKKRTCFSPGSVRSGVFCQVLPPSRVRSTTPCDSCV